jgi:hypothetical protein
MRGYTLYFNNQSSLESIRDQLRSLLHVGNPDKFKYGQTGTAVCDVMDQLLCNNEKLENVSLRCNGCGKIQSRYCPVPYSVISMGNNFGYKPSTALDLLINNWPQHQTCQFESCKGSMSNLAHFIRSPNMICMDDLPENINLCNSVKLMGSNTRNMIFKLVGIVYHGDFHFTSRYICANEMFYHDGMVARNFTYNGDLTKYDKSALRRYKNKTIAMVIYARK